MTARTTRGDRHQGRRRRQIAERYLELAQLIESEDGAALNVCVGVAILSGIASADAICLAALGERSASPDHAEAERLLRRVDHTAAKQLGILVQSKTRAHYGHALLSESDRVRALRAAEHLLEEAERRTR